MAPGSPARPTTLAPSPVSPGAGAGFGDWWRARRDRLLASPRFRRLAASFPLTRPIANRRARELFDLCAGFIYSQILLACVRLDVFALLRQAPLTPAEIAGRVDLPAEPARRLVAAAVSLRLLEERSGGRVGLGPLGAAMIDNPGIAAMVEHHALLYEDLADPVALLAGGGADTALGRYWAYARSDRPEDLSTERTGAYSALMGASQSMIAEVVLAAYPFSRHRCLLDVGGGEGAFVAAAAAKAPRLRLMLLDLPAVAARAERRFREAGLAERITTIGGDFFSQPLPEGADVVTLVRILHDHDDAAARALLAAVFRALPAGGTLIVAEPMAGTPGAEPIGDAYFGLYLFAMGQGRPRRPAELQAMLAEAGFWEIKLHTTRTPMLVRVMSARRTERRKTVNLN